MTNDKKLVLKFMLKIVALDIAVWIFAAIFFCDSHLWHSLPFLAVAICNICVVAANTIGMVVWSFFH